MKKVGIIGSGIVAKALAAGFLQLDYQVMMGSRDVNKINDVQGVFPGTVEETADFADLLVLAVKGTAAIKAIEKCNLDGKTVIDTTNPIADKPPVNGVLQFFTDLNSSLGEQLQAAYPNANFIKAFNSVGNTSMVDPNYNGLKPTMFICGNNDKAKSQVNEILDRFGWEVEDMGGIEACRAIEPLCILWCIPGFLRGQWTHAFKLLKQ